MSIWTRLNKFFGFTAEVKTVEEAKEPAKVKAKATPKPAKKAPAKAAKKPAKAKAKATPKPAKKAPAKAAKKAPAKKKVTKKTPKSTK